MQGTLLGTPRYMAPELLRGEAADARSDVFAFCVALYEALYGQHPFTGATQAESIQNQREGRARPPPMNSPVPTWVERPLMQGLRADPTQRPESMRALVAELEDDPEVRRRLRRRVVLVAALMSTLSALIVGGVLMRTEPQSQCARMERRLHGVWDLGMRWRVRQAILNTHLPYAQESFTRVSKLLDGYSAQWVKLRGEVCGKGAEQPPPAWVARGTECMERRREQLRVLTTEVLTRDMDAEHLAQAETAARSLSPLEICTDSKAMSAAVPPPEEPALRARVEALQTQMERLETLRLAGQYGEALESGAEWLREVEQVDYPHLQAQAYHQVARLKESVGKYADAEALARRPFPSPRRARISSWWPRRGPCS
ncbi:protein kinase domain-containing protein [Cystobacter fuscus]